MSFWWKSCLWISCIYRRVGHAAKLFFLHRNAWFHLCQLAYSMTAGAISLCNVFCKYRSFVFFSWTCRNMPAFCWWDPPLPFPEREPVLLQGCCSVWEDEFWEEEQLSQTQLGQNWSGTIQHTNIFSRKHFSFLLVQKPSLWEFSHTTTNSKGQNIGILTESQNSS